MRIWGKPVAENIGTYSEYTKCEEKAGGCDESAKFATVLNVRSWCIRVTRWDDEGKTSIFGGF